MNLAAAKVIGGKSSSPIFIKTQVVPQIKQRISQMIIFISDLRFYDARGTLKLQIVANTNLIIQFCSRAIANRKLQI